MKENTVFQDQFIPSVKARSLGERLLSWNMLLVYILLAIILIGTLMSPHFLNAKNLANSTFNFSEKGMLVLPMVLLIISRDIDLSIASIMVLASTAMGLAAGAGAQTSLIILAGLAVGAFAGIANGAIVTLLRLPSIVATIGTMTVYRGTSLAILGDGAVTKYPESLGFLGRSKLFGLVPLEFVTFLAMAAAFAFVLHRTTIGRRIYAIGNGPEAAFYSGVNVDRYRFVLFCFSGLVAGLAAVFLTSRIGSTRPNMAFGWELEVITMVVLGGVSIFGGRGGIAGVVLAVLIVGLFTFVLALVNVPGVVMAVFIGALLISAIALPIVLGKVREHRELMEYQDRPEARKSEA